MYICRWGLVQFRRSMANKKFLFNKWHIYRALFDMLDAMKVCIRCKKDNLTPNSMAAELPLLLV